MVTGRDGSDRLRDGHGRVDVIGQPDGRDILPSVCCASA